MWDGVVHVKSYQKDVGILAGEDGAKGSVWTSKCRRQGNIAMNLSGVAWIHLAFNANGQVVLGGMRPCL